MRLRVRLYSVFREGAGGGELEVEVGEGATVEEVVRALSAMHPGLGRALRVVGWSYIALDESGVRLSPGDRAPDGLMHLMPPVSGGGRVEVGLIRGGDAPVGEIIGRLASGGETGAIAVFIGLVKGYSEDGEVRELHYEYAEGLLLSELERIAREEAGEHGASGVVLMHAVGERRPGQQTIIVGVSGRSRKNVLPALKDIVERVKREPPIWKTEVLADGSRVFIVGDKRVKEEDIKGVERAAGPPNA